MSYSIPESILDDPRDTLCPEVWNLEADPPVLGEEAQEKIDKLVQWVQDKHRFSSLSVYMIGSICSNSYSSTSDIDIDFCTPDLEAKSEEEMKDAGWSLKKEVVDGWLSKSPDDAAVGTHPFEVYFSANPFQCFMSVGCYNVLERKWEVGPELKDMEYDPVSELYRDAMKQADAVLDDIRLKILELYETAFVCKKSDDDKFKAQQRKELEKLVRKAASLYDSMKKVRSNFQKPCKSREEALERRRDKKQHAVDAAFKFLDKFGYISMLKDFVQLKYDIDADADTLDGAEDQVLKSVSSNMQLKHLQDSEDENDKKLLGMMQEADGMLEESASGMVKLSVIAALMAVSSFMSVDALTKNLAKAKREDPKMTVNSPAAKKAIAASAKDNAMLGSMSKTNVVNAVAKVLWKEARGEGKDGLMAVASVIWNRADGNPADFVLVIKQKKQFSCLNSYDGGWTDKDYKWYNPRMSELANKTSAKTWETCKSIALKMADKDFKSTIGNRNVYANDALDDKSNLDSWGKDCDLKVGNHRFGYRKEHDPKYVVPGTFTAKKSISKDSNVVVVKAGDTLSKIAKDHNMSLAKLLKLNKGLKNPDAISIGQKIKIG